MSKEESKSIAIDSQLPREYDPFTDPFPEGYLYSKRIDDIRVETLELVKGYGSYGEVLAKVSEEFDKVKNVAEFNYYPSMWEYFYNSPEVKASIIFGAMGRIIKLLANTDKEFIDLRMISMRDNDDSSIRCVRYSHSQEMSKDRFSLAARMEAVCLELMNIEANNVWVSFNHKNINELVALGRIREKLDNHNQILSHSAKEKWAPMIDAVNERVSGGMKVSHAINSVARIHGVKPSSLHRSYYRKK